MHKMMGSFHNTRLSNISLSFYFILFMPPNPKNKKKRNWEIYICTCRGSTLGFWSSWNKLAELSIIRGLWKPAVATVVIVFAWTKFRDWSILIPALVLVMADITLVLIKFDGCRAVWLLVVEVVIAATSTRLVDGALLTLAAVAATTEDCIGGIGNAMLVLLMIP